MVNDTHIIGPLSIVSFTYEHFQIELHVIGLFIEPHKYVIHLAFGLPLGFNTPFQFITPLERSRVLGVPLGISSFTSSFIKKCPIKRCLTIDFFPRMGDV
jgi:hypothetical protein